MSPARSRTQQETEHRRLLSLYSRFRYATRLKKKVVYIIVILHSGKSSYVDALLQTLSAGDMKKMSGDMTSSVTYLHQLGIVHRDIAARNFL